MSCAIGFAVIPGMFDILSCAGFGTAEGAGTLAGCFLDTAEVVARTVVLDFVTFFAGAFFVAVFALAFGLAVEVFFIVSGIDIPGMPVCCAERVELAVEKTASTAAKAATYLFGILDSSLMIGPVASFATETRDQKLLTAELIERDYAFGGGGSKSGDWLEGRDSLGGRTKPVGETVGTSRSATGASVELVHDVACWQ